MHFAFLRFAFSAFAFCILRVLRFVCVLRFAILVVTAFCVLRFAFRAKYHSNLRFESKFTSGAFWNNIGLGFRV